jgi:Protein phosphatase 2C
MHLGLQNAEQCQQCSARAAGNHVCVHAIFREAERKRIERTNPNPKMPLVRFVGDTWRTGGVLALSRAFGDAYLKVMCAVSIWCLPSESSAQQHIRLTNMRMVVTLTRSCC